MTMLLPLELWGGVECTVNRVGDRYFDQVRRTGHHDREDDMERVARLSIKALRFPVLWERHAKNERTFDWSWSDLRLEYLRARGIRPILTLLHHGAGPAWTGLLDDAFPQKFAAFAAAAAERYGWVRDWTPINEPLTTARFSGLYGLWHPHSTDEQAFWKILVNEIEAIGLAMGAIRRAHPGARLIQTEDLGKTYAWGAARAQAAHDNARRWMTWDLLAGRVGEEHPLWRHLVHAGLARRVGALAEAPTPADVVGVNHYLTSDRFLDPRVHLYPADKAGRNDAIAFADIEAVRLLQPAPQGLEGALREAAERYGKPVAATEIHNGCTREEQLRWLSSAWCAAQRLRSEGVGIEAITAWALFGAYDWDSLLCEERGRYECGAFDVRSPIPRRTALADLITSLATEDQSTIPCAGGAGWWERDARLIYAPVERVNADTKPPRSYAPTSARQQPILICGATGTLGRAVALACEMRALPFVLTDRRMLALDEPSKIEAALTQWRPWAVVNAAGWVRVDDAEANRAACMRANTEGAQNLARACAARGLPFATFSSDLVFSGEGGRAYKESDATGPLNVYGESKASAEVVIGDAHPTALIIRTAAFFSAWDEHNFAHAVVRALSDGIPFHAADDLVISPTFVPDLVSEVLDQVIDGEAGIRHLCNDGAVSWFEFARMVAAGSGLDPSLVQACPHTFFGWPAPRPAYVPLTTERGHLLPDLQDAVWRFAAAMRA